MEEVEDDYHTEEEFNDEDDDFFSKIPAVQFVNIEKELLSSDVSYFLRF